MKKRIVSLILAVAMILSVAPTAFAVDGSLDNFKGINTYTTGQFTDVDAAQWYAPYVTRAYELGLMKGSSDTTFDPNGYVTIAETLALASRLHNIYYGGDGNFEQGTPWYQVYAEYAENEGIIGKGSYSNYAFNTTRAQFAAIFAKALPAEALSAINDIAAGSLPDLAVTEWYATPAYLLYNAGILTGSDQYGTFNAQTYIQRSEVAAIVVRMAVASERKEFTPEHKQTAQEIERANLIEALDTILEDMKTGGSEVAAALDSLIEAVGTTGKRALEHCKNAQKHFAAAKDQYSAAVALCENHTETQTIKTYLKTACDALTWLSTYNLTERNVMEYMENSTQKIDIVTDAIGDSSNESDKLVNSLVGNTVEPIVGIWRATLMTDGDGVVPIDGYISIRSDGTFRMNLIDTSISGTWIRDGNLKSGRGPAYRMQVANSSDVEALGYYSAEEEIRMTVGEFVVVFEK